MVGQAPGSFYQSGFGKGMVHFPPPVGQILSAGPTGVASRELPTRQNSFAPLRRRGSAFAVHDLVMFDSWLMPVDRRPPEAVATER